MRLLSRKTKISEAGRRNSAVDQARIQEAHDHMVGLGAQCQEDAPVAKAKEAIRLAETLRADDSFQSTTDAIRKAAQALLCDPDQPTYNQPYVYVRDVFDADAIVQFGDTIYQIPYRKGVGGDEDGDDVVLGEPMEVDVAYIPAGEDESDASETRGDDIVEGLFRSRLSERNIPQSTRKTLDKGDFAGKGKSFPIVKPGDVGAALSSIGRAGSSNYPAAKLKSNILAIAKRKGFPVPASDKTEAIDSEKVTESAAIEISTEFVELREAAIGADGSGLIKIIQPGWGSSGYYSPDVLKRDGPKVFTKGTKMFWDHQTAAEEAARPEGSLDDLASELTGNAYWDQNGPKGAALYAPVKAFEAYKPAINDLSKSIGVSIRASGRAQKGTAEGKEGPIITSLESAKSIDYVTSPGAGGEILQLFEAARSRQKPNTQESEMEVKNLQEANAQLTAQAAQISTQAAELAKLRESVIVGQAAGFVRESLASVSLPGVTKTRLTSELVAAMPLKENALDTAAYKTKIDEAVKAAVAEIAAITGAGQIQGMGAAPTADDTKAIAEANQSLEASFQLLGLKESTAKLAAKGRI
jgi:hypothetical protein